MAAAHAEVVTEVLPELHRGTVGIETGLPKDIWGKKPEAAEVLNQIKNAAEAPLNDSEKSILKSILMTDMGGVVALEEMGDDFLIARVEALMAQGMIEEALALIDKVPAGGVTGAVKRLKAEVLFVAGRTQEACGEGYLNAFDSEEAFVRAICADVAGVPPASALAYEVYRESGHDDHPFLNAAGEVLYRNLEGALPDGGPSVWEMPVIARVWGMDVMKRPLSKTQLRVLINQERVPQEVRQAAEEALNQLTVKQPDGQILTHLIQMAENRVRLEEGLKGGYAK